jgi:LacI family transcriptional regulator
VVSQKTIAERLGISRSSVAAILTGRGSRYSEVMRSKVLAAADAFGYRPNASALTIRKGVNENTVALIADPIKDKSLLYMIMSKLDEYGYGVRIYKNYDRATTFQDIAANQINKIVNMESNENIHPEMRATCLRYSIRMVSIGTVGTPEFPVFKTDNAFAMRQMVEHLYSIGHKKITLYCGPHKRITTDERHNGFLAALREFGLECDSSNVLCEEFDTGMFFDFLRRKRPSAICGIYPGLTLRMERELIKSGLNVPEEISLVNFGNREGIATEYACVPLDCVVERTEDIVEGMVKYLIEFPDAAQPDKNGKVLFETDFVRAESSAPPSDNFEQRMASVRYVENWNDREKIRV